MRNLAFYINPHADNRREMMKYLSDHGIRLVGIDGNRWHFENRTDETGIADFKKDLDEFGLNLCSMHSCFPILTSTEDGTSPDLFEAQLNELRTFALLGGHSAVYHATWIRDLDASEIGPAIDRIGWNCFVEMTAKTVKMLAEEASRNNIYIVLENLTLESFSDSAAKICEIVISVSEPNVGILLDSGHTHLAGLDVADEIRQAGNLLKDVHFHDNAGAKVNGELIDQHLPPGLGTINWQNVIGALNEIHYSGPIAFEGVLNQRFFDGKLTYKDLIDITLNNWHAFECFKQCKQTF